MSMSSKPCCVGALPWLTKAGTSDALAKARIAENTSVGRSIVALGGIVDEGVRAARETKE